MFGILEWVFFYWPIFYQVIGCVHLLVFVLFCGIIYFVFCVWCEYGIYQMKEGVVTKAWRQAGMKYPKLEVEARGAPIILS